MKFHEGLDRVLTDRNLSGHRMARLFDLAGPIGEELSPATINRYRNGETEPTISVAVAIAQVLGVPLSDLVDDGHEVTPECRVLSGLLYDLGETQCTVILTLARSIGYEEACPPARQPDAPLTYPLPSPAPPARLDAAGDDQGDGDQLGDDRRGDDLPEAASAAAHHAQGDDVAAGASGRPWPVLRASCPRKTLTRSDAAGRSRDGPRGSPRPPVPVPAAPAAGPPAARGDTARAGRPTDGASCRRSAGVVPAGSSSS